MSKFTPLDLTQYFNANQVDALDAWHPELAEALSDLPTGEQTFWGMPFDLAPADAAGWILLDGEGQAATVPVSGAAGYVVFLHFCNAAHDHEGEGQPAGVEYGVVTRPGEHLADYVLVYEDGHEHRQPIRRRFEINEPQAAWGHTAFAARSHGEQKPVSFRDPLPPNSWGRYQTGVGWTGEGSARYWLFAMENPRPEARLKAIRLEATGADRVAVAGITLFAGAHHPLRHHRLETLRVTLPEDEASLADEVEATIDLGTIARQYTVPAFDPAAWLAAEVQGWGEEPEPAAPDHELLLDVTASPDATLSVERHEVALGTVYTEGVASSHDGAARVEILTPRRTWVHVSVEDETTSRPTPARVHFRAPDGRYLPPYGHRHEVNDNWFEDYGADAKLGSTEYAYVDGRFQIELPVGDVYAEIAKGFEYRPLRQKLTIAPGQRALRLRLERSIDMRNRGWVTADTHVHFLSPETAWLEAQSEGINLVNLLASQWGDLFTNVGDISGDLSGVSRDDTLIWVGTENRQHLLGHISMLGVKGAPVFPMCAAGPGESYLGDPTWSSLAEWADACRQREGVVVLPHFPRPQSEVVADIILGKIDGVEIRDFHKSSLDTFAMTEWYRFLNCGYRVAAVGGTDKMFAGMPLGGVRTYAYLGDEEFTFANWARAVRAGRTFTTSGPIIGLRVEGRVPGDEIRLPAGGGTLAVEAWAESTLPFHELEVVVNGRVVARETSDEGVTKLALNANVRLEGSGWIAARCGSRHIVWHGWPVHVTAHTSPVYVVAEDADLFSPSDATYMLTLLDGGLTWLDTLSIPADPGRHERIKDVFRAAQAELEGRLG